jgi:hypothetical protein
MVGVDMVKSLELADLVVKTVAVKLQAMEELDSGLLSRTSVTTIDRVAVVLGTVKLQYQEKVLATEPTEEDLEVARRVLEESGVEFGKEELVALAKLRRYVANRTASEGISLFIGKALDIERGERFGRLALPVATS